MKDEKHPSDSIKKNKFIYTLLADPVNFVPPYLQICLSFPQSVHLQRKNDFFPLSFNFIVYKLINYLV